MTDAVQLPRISPVKPRPVRRRAVAAATPAAAGSDQSQSDALPPVDPVSAVEPKTSLSITRDDAANALVFRSIDRDSGDVISQYPAEQVLRLVHRLRELEGLDEHKVDTSA
jgi:hypothetical protein